MLAIEKIEPDPAAAKLVGEFMNALTIADEAERLQAILPLVHDSLKTKDKKDLFSNVKQFSYKRAVNMIKLYKNPVELGNVHKGSVSTIGFKETAETGVAKLCNFLVSATQLVSLYFIINQNMMEQFAIQHVVGNRSRDTRL